jgi:hypothetical protein
MPDAKTGDGSDEETDNPHPTAATCGKFLGVTRSCRYYRGQQHGYEQGLTLMKHLNCDFGIALNDASTRSQVSRLSLRGVWGREAGGAFTNSRGDSVVIEAGGAFHQNLFPIVGTNNPYDVTATPTSSKTASW